MFKCCMKTHNRSTSLFLPWAGSPSNSLVGQYNLFFSHNAFSSAKAFVWDSFNADADTGGGSGRLNELGGVSYAAMLAFTSCLECTQK